MNEAKSCDLQFFFSRKVSLFDLICFNYDPRMFVWIILSSFFKVLPFSFIQNFIYLFISILYIMNVLL